MQIYPYQRECLNAIGSARQAGRAKALVVMATGLGKTVVSALQLRRSLAEAPGRVLYVTHQNEILRQARHTYERFLPTEMTYGYFHGEEKHLHKVDVLFASFQTMVNSRELFARDEFKYIIVDEAHHVHAETYRPTVEYFQPDFMIGLTATPNRADRKDITELMGEPVFHLDLFEALADRHLTPINYRLMTDELQNLEALETPAGKLSIAKLNRTIFVPKRDEEIVRIIDDRTVDVQHPRVIIFCASIAHAERLEEIMPHAILLHSRIPLKIRRKRIDEFRSTRAATIITVDAFNEGIDIPEANVIVFLRSTASRTIYLQQLGRGLRRSPGKAKVLVLDFVANCERIEIIDYVKQGVENAAKESVAMDCSVESGETDPTLRDMLTLTIDGGEFDERLVNLIDLVNRARQGYTKEELTEQLLAFAEKLGRTPTMMEVDKNKAIASTPAYCNMFKTNWNGVIAAVGLELTIVRRTKEQLSEQLLAFASELGRAPTQKEVNTNKAMASASTYHAVFGTSWNGVLAAVGIKPTRTVGYTKEVLTEQLLAFAEKLGRTPTVMEVDANKAMASSPTYFMVFNTTWNGVLAAVGLKQTRQSPVIRNKEVLATELLELAAKLGRTPTSKEVDNNKSVASTGAYLRAFGGTWNSVLAEVGLKPNMVMSRKK